MPPRRSRAQYEPARLPLALTPLLGRARELEELLRLLRGTRLLSITGAGGSGKTRLALELAHRVRATPADVIWVELAPIGDAELVARQIVDAMGVRELAAEDVLQVVIDTVRDRSILFVLDNCEHLVDAAAVVTQEILQSCPNATVLATSRESLGIAGEQTWLVPPLSEEDAVLLFLERARAVVPAFQAGEDVVQTICRRLDGIPLAIELAAARVKVLPIEEIAARLDDAFRLLTSGSRTAPRHRTIHETIDWSYRLLLPEEQVLFRQLAVFAGTFTISAVEAIFGKDALELVSALVDKSLLLAEGSRYRLLDTVRQFATEKLEESGGCESCREKHARYFVGFAEEMEPLIFAGAVDRSALARIDQELGNIRAVFDGATDPELVLRLLYALRWYWFARGHFHEARRRINSVLPRAKDVEPVLRAKAAIAAGDAAVWQADWASLRPSIDDAVETLRGTNDPRALTSALRLLATAKAFAAGDHAGALATCSEAIEIARREGLDVNLALTLYWRGLIVQLHSDWSAARTAFEEAYEAGVALGNTVTIAHPLTALAHIALFQGRREEAIDALRRAMDLHTRNDDRWGLTQVVEGIGLVLLDGGDAETGTRLLAAAAAAWLHLGARPARGAAFEEEKSGRIREALGDERLRVVLASGAAMSYDTMLALARESLAEVHSAGAAAVKVRALGPLEIERDSVQVEESLRARELLLYLLCHPGGQTKEQIGAALWPDADPARLRNNVHVTLHRLRKLLGDADWITVENETYRVDRKKGIELDADVFEREVGAAMRARNADRLSLSLELYRGDFFANATTGEWHLETRDRLRDLYAKALDQLARLRVFENDYSKAAVAYRRLVQLDSLDEEAAAGLIGALLKLGDRAGAVRAWERLAKMLRRELGVFPTVERPS
jgi:predicted ATPase/DNA-binding SARP family transcriptional activator